MREERGVRYLVMVVMFLFAGAMLCSCRPAKKDEGIRSDPLAGERTMNAKDSTHDDPGAAIHLRPRYYRLNTDGAVEMAETNFRHAELDWKMPLRHGALVLVDCWNIHFAKDTHARIDQITTGKIAPLLAACRRRGLTVIHAPGAPVAQRYRNWVRLVGDDEQPQPAYPNSPVWPPADFRKFRGQYAQYARPPEPQDVEVKQKHRRELRDFHPAARPTGSEPVVLSGEELHRLCAQRGIVNLFYVGFNTNACIVLRDYGIHAMRSRGYNTILIRDCTTGMETHETQKGMACTQGTIASLEQFGTYTLTSKQLIDALSR